jgi:hypothetical protein
MSARYFVFDTHGNCILQGEMNAVSSKFQGIPNVGLLDSKVRHAPSNPHAPQLAELLCQSGQCSGNSLAHNSFTHIHGEISICSSELQRGHLIFHSSATLPFTPSESTKPPICHKVSNRQRFCHFLPEPTMLRRGTKDRANIFFQSHVELYDYVIRTVS